MNIVLTGGGTAGHAMANKVILPYLQQDKENTLHYIGSKHGAERRIIEVEPDVDYHAISTGKLRRYLSFENIIDLFRVMRGIKEAYLILHKLQANVVFSGGGYVSLPVVIAAWLLKIPVIIRETDISAGLANRICARFAQKVFTTFPDTVRQFSHVSCEYGGLIIRPQLLTQSAEISDSKSSLPVMLIIGGSLGSETLNRLIWDHVENLTCRFKIIHLCGVGKTNPDLCIPGYVQYEYADNMAKLYASASIVVTRCGSNAVSEGLALGKRMVCIPLPSRSSRGEQTANAEFAVKHGCAVILNENDLSLSSFLNAVSAVLEADKKTEFEMNPSQLHENCCQLQKEIQKCAVRNMVHRMISSVRNGREPDWHKLSLWEFHMYQEITEEYGC